MAADNKNIRRGIELYIDGKEVKNNINSVKAEMRKLRKEIDGLTHGSDEYYKATSRYRQLNKILTEHRSQLKGVEVQQQSMLGRGASLFKQYALEITGAVAALTGVSMQLASFRRQLSEKEDASANLRALTGLDEKNVAWLTGQAEKLSTTMEASGLRVRQSATEILNAYMLVGSAKPELLSNKEALNAVTVEAMRLAEAAKMDLKEAVDALTTSLNQYGESSEQAARYTNVLAAGSKSGAANVQEQAAAVVKAGVAASSAGVSFEQLVGTIEMLGEKGIKAEEAGTALKRFFLTLQTGASDTNPAVVGLDAALENLAGKHLSMGELQKMFGDRAINVAKILIDNTDKVRQYTEAVTGTSVAVEQAAINSDTSSARMAQLRNEVNLAGQALAKALSPALSESVGWMRKLIAALPPLINFLKQYGGELAILAATYAVISLRVAALAKATAVYNSVVSVSTKMIAGYRAAMVLTRDIVAGCTVAQNSLTASLSAQNIVVRLAVAATTLLKTAYYALTLQMTAASRSLKAFTVAMASTGWGAAIAAAGLLAAAIFRVRNAHREEMEARKRAIEEEQEQMRAYYDEKTRLDSLYKTLTDNTAAYEDRRKALEAIKKIVPDYHAALSKEGRLFDDNRKAIDLYLENLKKVTIEEMKYEKLKGLYREEAQVRAKREDADKRAAELAEKNKGRTIQQWLTGRAWGVGMLNGIGTITLGLLGDKEAAVIEEQNELMKEWLKIKKDINALEKDIDTSLLPQVADSQPASLGAAPLDTESGGGSAKERKKRQREELEAIDAEYNRRSAELKQQYIDGDIATEQEYSARLAQMEMDRLREKMRVAGLDEKQQSEFLDKMMDMEMTVRRRIEDMTKTSAKDTTEARLDELERQYDASRAYITEAYKSGIIPTEERYKEYLLALETNYGIKRKELLAQQADERLEDLRSQQDAELQELKLSLAKRLMTEEEYARKVLEVRRRYALLRSEVQNQSVKATQQTAAQEKEIEIEEAQQAAQGIREYTEQMKDMAADVSDAFGELGENLADALFGDDFSESMKKAGKEFLKMALDIVERYILIKQAQIMADAIAQASTIFGAASAIAKATAKMVAIKAAFGLAKGAINNFYTGGFTPVGEWDEPQGIVHSGEFVANRHAVRNPQVLPVLRLIDAAQRSGNIANLSGQQIAAVASGRAAATPPAASMAANPATAESDNAELLAVLARLSRTMDIATKAYQQPSPSYCYVTGRGGINEAQSLAKRMDNNASRK